MSIYRQVKTLVTLDVTIIAFVVWTTVTNFLFKNAADYKLFFISLTAVLLMQYIYIKKKNKYLAILLPLALFIPFIFTLSKGIDLFLNTIFVVLSVSVNLAMEEMPVNYEEYKTTAKQGAIILIIIAVLSIGLEKSVANFLYRFFINYMIVTVILLRESRAYQYKVSLEYNEDEAVSKKTFINILFKYSVVIASTIILTTDWILNKSLNLLNILNNGADIIISYLIDFIAKILEPIINGVIHCLQRFFTKTEFSNRLDNISNRLMKNTKNINLKKGGATISDSIFVNIIFKIIILLMIILLVVNMVKNMKFLKHKSEQYVEDKEKIYKDIRKNNSKNHRNNISSIIKRVFKNGTLKEKILYAYWNFEKITDKAKIYETYMTATQLKEETKLNLKHDEYLDVMTDIYNEVKFSNLEPKEDQLDIVKRAVDNAKKQI